MTWVAWGVVVAVVFGVPALIIAAWTMRQQINDARNRKKATIRLHDPEDWYSEIRTWIAGPPNQGAIKFELWVLNLGEATARNVSVEGKCRNVTDRYKLGRFLGPNEDAQVFLEGPDLDGPADLPPADPTIVVRYEDLDSPDPHEQTYCYRFSDNAATTLTDWQAHRINCNTRKDITDASRGSQSSPGSIRRRGSDCCASTVEAHAGMEDHQVGAN